MLLNLFNEMRAAKVPVSVRELLDLHQALQKHVVFADMDEFYYLARAILVKDERHFDKFDRAFAAYFKGLENLDRHIEALIPEDWFQPRRHPRGRGWQTPGQGSKGVGPARVQEPRRPG